MARSRHIGRRSRFPSSTKPANDLSPVSSRPIPLILRILSGIAAVVVFLFGLVLSFGAILGAPLGMWLVQRWTRRNDRRPSRVASMVGAALASSVLAGLLWS